MIVVLSALIFPAARGATLPEGAYAMELDVATDVRLPVVGWQRVVTRSVLLAWLEGTGPVREQRQQLCRVQVIGGRPATTVVPEAFVAAYPEQRYPVTLHEGADGWRFSADMGPTHVGYDPTRSSGALPEEPTEAVLDFEDDGHPGATVHLEVPVLGTVDLYVVQHAHSKLSGEVTADGVRGRVDVQVLEQNTIGATHRLFLGDRPMRVGSDDSRFRMVPVSADADCDAVDAALAGTAP